jgi:hypothetical protein
VPAFAPERVGAFEFRDQRHVQAAGAVDHVAGELAAAVREGHFPQTGFVDESRPFDLLARIEVRPEAELVHAVLGVGLDLVPGRVLARPVGVGFEGETVKVRLHVAGGAGVAVPVPGSTRFGRLVGDPEVADACFEKPFAEANATKAGADDQRVEYCVFALAHG